MAFKTETIILLTAVVIKIIIIIIKINESKTIRNIKPKERREPHRHRFKYRASSLGQIYLTSQFSSSGK